MTETCRQQLSGMDLAILNYVKDEPFNGLDDLAIAVAAGRRSYFGKRVRRLRDAGLITLDVPAVICRGRKVVIRRRDGK